MNKVTVPSGAQRNCHVPPINWGQLAPFADVPVHELQIEALREDLNHAGLVDMNLSRRLAEYLNRLGYRRIVETR